SPTISPFLATSTEASVSNVSWPIDLTCLSSSKYCKASKPQPGKCSCPSASLFSKRSISGHRLDQSLRKATKVPGSIEPCSASHCLICSRVKIKSASAATSCEKSKTTSGNTSSFKSSS